MSRLQVASASRRHRSHRLQTRNQRFQVETLECRALLSGLTVNAAYGISGKVNVYDIATDAAGNTYLTGAYTGSATFGTGTTETNPTPHPETFVVSYSPTGAVNWYDEFQNQLSDTSSTSEGDSLAYDPGNQTVYVGGAYTGAVDFDHFGQGDIETSSVDSVTGADAYDAYLIGINATGASAGKENSSAGFTDFAATNSQDMYFNLSEVRIDPTGDFIYVTGSYSNYTTVLGAGPQPITFQDAYGDAYTLAQPPTAGSSEGFSMVFDYNELAYWAVNTYDSQGGTLDNALNYGIAPNVSDGLDYVVGEDSNTNSAFVEILNDNDGSFVAMKELTLVSPSASSTDYAYDVVTDSAGNAYVVGTFSGTLALPNGNLTSAGATNGYIVSFDNNLDELWADRFGSSNPTAEDSGTSGPTTGDDADSVAIDGASTPNIYVSGADEGPSTYGTSTTAVVGQSATNVEAYVIEVSSSDGSFISGAGATGTGNSVSEAGKLAVNSAGQVAIAGNVTSPTTLGTTALPAADTAFVANLSTTTTTTTPFDLAITNTDGATTYTAGGTATYTIVVTNHGPTAVTGAAVNDLLPKSISSATWTAVASTGSSVTKASGTGSIVKDLVSLPVNGTVTFTLVANIASTAKGDVATSATVSTTAATPAGVVDSNPANNSATDTDTPPSTPKPVYDLAITMTDGSTTYTAGGSTTYTIVVTNNGPAAVTGATVNDSLPSGIASDSWTAAAAKGASVKTSKGTGNIFNDVVDLPAGATVTFTVVAKISASATGNLVNTATVSTTATTPKGVTDTSTANNSFSLTLKPPTTSTPPPPPPKPVPPVFLGEQRIFAGKRKHKKLVGFEFRFNSALNAALAQAAGNYHVTQKKGKKVKVLPIKSASYNASGFDVTIAVGGFKTGKAQATISGLAGANGAAIASIVTGL